MHTRCTKQVFHSGIKKEQQSERIVEIHRLIVQVLLHSSSSLDDKRRLAKIKLVLVVQQVFRRPCSS